MPANTTELEKRLWEAADQLRANSDLKSHEYSVPVLGLIFLRYADHKFAQAKETLVSKSSGRRTIGKADYQAQGVLYLPENAWGFAPDFTVSRLDRIGEALKESPLH
jgi:type I restriction enzyme M protein